MDPASSHAHTSPELPETPPAAVELAPAFNADRAFNTPGFSKFVEDHLEKTGAKIEDFDSSDDNAPEIERLFKAFEGSKVAGLELVGAWSKKLTKDKQRLTPNEITAFKKNVEELAAEDPDGLAQLQADLRKLETDPIDNRRLEEEFVAAARENDALRREFERLQAEQKTLGDTIDAMPSPPELNYFQKLSIGLHIPIGRDARITDRRARAQDRFDTLQAQVTEMAATFRNSTNELTDMQTAVENAREEAKSLQMTIFKDGVLAKKINERIGDAARKELDAGLEATTWEGLAKVAKRFSEHEKMEAQSPTSNYLDTETHEFDREGFKTKLNEKIQGVVASSILKTLETTSAGHTQQRLESAYRGFITKASQGFGMSAADAHELVLGKLREARQALVDKKAKGGAIVMTARIISRLERGAPART